MRTPVYRSARLFAAAAIAAGAVAAVPAGGLDLPVLTPEPRIVQGADVSAALTAVRGVLPVGDGRVLHELPLVNGVAVALTDVEVGLLDGVALPVTTVTPDAEVLTQSLAAKPGPSAPRVVNVFRELTGAASLARSRVTGAGVGVAVVDTGVAKLSDFGKRLRAGVDLSGEGNAHLDGFGHGTFVAGLIAGSGSSSGGAYAGEATGAHVVPVKVAGASGSTTLSTVIRGLQWVHDNTADDIQVINLSMGTRPVGPTALNPLNQAVEAMWRAGFVVVTSAGNSGDLRGTITSPGDSPLVITAGAVDDRHTVAATDDVVPSFSSRGPTAWDGWWKPDLLAPGQSVVSVMPTTSATWGAHPSARIGKTNFIGSGTSFSAAITSGAAALLLQAKPSALPDEVKAALLTTTNAGPAAAPGVHDPFEQGHGVLDVARAVAQPAISMTQSVAGVPIPALGAEIDLALTQAASTWRTSVLAAHLDPFPYTGPATTSTDPNGLPLFSSTPWNGSAWNGSAWNGSAWNGSAWNGSAWNGSAWNGSAWNGSAWN